MPHVQVDGEHHISRYCNPSSISHDGKPLACAFELRSHEEYLSVNWLEYFEAKDLNQAIDFVRQAFSRKRYTIKPNGRFALFQVIELLSLIEESGSSPAKIEHIPEENDLSHCGVFGYTSSDESIALEIARSVHVKDMHLAIPS